MDNVINLKLLSCPINWLIVWVVLLIAGFAYAKIVQGVAHTDCGCSDAPD